ncbi:unnamed protein product [Pieris macdunnoughi]|uniref:Reverse transcriptase domain-containing protein n=1 Tax=Pieris macdunnoughi TaxID=345717 RepID=A0A821WT95_9NEOP|nr:unnamed protein product [Pieris macdunnoughi]
MSSMVISHVSESKDPLSSVDPLHPPIEFCIDIVHKEKLNSHEEARFRFHKADYEKITSDLNNIPWHSDLSYCASVDDMVAQFYKILRVIISKHVPKSKPRSSKYPIWFSAALVKVLVPMEYLLFFAIKCASELALPLSIIINSSLNSGIFPTVWKSALVIPLFKSGDTSAVLNYRPISILPTFAKVFESILCPIISSHFKHFIAPEQHGFAKSRSTSTNLVSFVEDLAEGVDRGQSYDAIYTDFSRAFDRVSHVMLIHKLSSIGIDGIFLNWCRSYLSNRQSVVVVGGYKSKEFTAISGVRQGSHLGPLFFNIFINDIGSCVQGSKFLMFADDLKLYRTVNSPEEAMSLQNDLDNLIMWCSLNGMNLNPEKCHVVRFSRKKRSPTRVYHINQAFLKDVSHTRDLGVILDGKLRFNLHVDDITNRAFRMLGFVLRNCKEFRNPSTNVTIYTCLVRSILEYCSPVWNPHYGIYIKRLENVQKRFLWHLSYGCNMARKLPSYNDRLLHFHLKSLRHRRELLDIMFLYKLINGILDTPDILSRVNISVPKKLQRFAKPPFRIKFAKSNLGQNAPLNRSLRSYNLIHSVEIDGGIGSQWGGREFPQIDLFSNSPSIFKKLAAQLITH